MNEFWIVFWSACLVLGAGSFALITVAIAWNGARELIELIRDLDRPAPGADPGRNGRSKEQAQ